MKKIIVFLTNLLNNGISNFLYNYLSFMPLYNFDITILCSAPIDQEILEKFKTLNIKFKIVTSKKVSLTKYTHEVKKILENTYDVSHINGNSGTMALECWLSKKSQIKKIILHNHNTSCDHPFIFGPKSVFTWYMKRHADGLLACSKDAGKWLFKNNYLILNNAININKYMFNFNYRHEIRSKYSIDDSTYIIGQVGLFNKQKNQEFTLNVFQIYLKKNPNALLMFVGEGSNLDYIKNKVNELMLNDKVIFCGSRTDVFKYYSAMDLFILPSIFEGFGIVNVEAQASGLPCLVSDKVIREVKCSDKFNYESLEASFETWADGIENLKKDWGLDRSVDIERIRKAGFDITLQASILYRIYNN